MAHVGVCTPHGDVVDPQFNRSVTIMQGHWPQHQFVSVEVDVQIVGKARNMLVETGRPAGIDVFWFIDDDVLVPPHSAMLVDQALELGVVGGLYFNRRPPFTPQVYELANEPHNIGMYWPIIDYPKGGTEPVDGIGAGCLAVRADVFDVLERSWEAKRAGASQLLLGAGFNSLGKIVSELSPWFEFLDRKGEDLYFSERCLEAGVQIYCNYGVKCDHLGSIPISEVHFKYLMDNNLIKRIDGKVNVHPGIMDNPSYIGLGAL